MIDKIKDLYISNYRVNSLVKKSVLFLLKTPLFTMNPVYRNLYNKNVRALIPRLTEKINTVMLEVGNYCNLACNFCPHVELKRPKGFMNFDLFKKIVDDCHNEGVSNLLLYGMGEPLMDKNYFEKIRYAAEKGIPDIECVTNAILLDKKKAEAVVDSGLTRLLVSMDSSTPESYKEFHRHHKTLEPCDKFETVIENLRYLVDYRAKKGKTLPMIYMRFRESPSNKKDVRQFKKTFVPIVDRLKIDMNIFNWPGSSNDQSSAHLSYSIKFPCYNLWSQLFISYDGKVGLCCLDYEFKVRIGDITRQNLGDIWNGSELARIRGLHLQGRFDDIALCKDCLLNTHLVMPWWFGPHHPVL